MPPEKISSTYSYSSCLSWITIITPSIVYKICKSSIIMNMEVLKLSPPFTYNYQCGSTLLTIFIPVYIYTIVFQIIVDLVKIITILNTNYNNSSKLILHSAEYIIKHNSFFISNIINSIVLLLSIGLSSFSLSLSILVGVCTSISCWLILIGQFVFATEEFIFPLKNDQTSTKNNEIEMMDSNLKLPTDLFDSTTTSHNNLLNAISKLNECFRYIREDIHACKWLIIGTSCFFNSLVCWDIVGDQQGWYGALWVPLLGLGLFILFWFLNWLLNKGFLREFIKII